MPQVLDFFRKLFDTSDFPARWHCGRWTDFHGWLYILSDLLVWSAYFTIPLLIFGYIRKKAVPFHNVFYLFGSFILACGFTHLVDAVIFWHPVYRLSALARFFTGVISWVTVFAIIRVLPLAFAMRTPADFEEEIEKRKGIEKALKKTEQELLQKTRDLETKLAELQRFAFVASHDLKEPLRKISLFSSKFQSEFSNQLPKKGLMYLHRIQENAARQQQLVDEVLQLAQLANTPSVKAKVSLQELAEEAAADLEVMVQETNAIIHIGHLPEAEVAPIQIRQLFQNLLSNALKFRLPDNRPNIQISSEIVTFPTVNWPQRFQHDFTILPDPTHSDTEQFCKIVVQDNGIGFEPEYAENIFQMFKRLHGHEYDGTGLGLAVCKQIVENHHGSIAATSRPGKGATFTILLPLKSKPFNDSDK